MQAVGALQVLSAIKQNDGEWHVLIRNVNSEEITCARLACHGR